MKGRGKVGNVLCFVEVGAGQVVNLGNVQTVTTRPDGTASVAMVGLNPDHPIELDKGQAEALGRGMLNFQERGGVLLLASLDLESLKARGGEG